jgi:hypothetical protein
MYEHIYQFVTNLLKKVNLSLLWFAGVHYIYLHILLSTECPYQMMLGTVTINTMGGIKGAATANLSGAYELIPGFSGVRVAQPLTF